DSERVCVSMRLMGSGSSQGPQHVTGPRVWWRVHLTAGLSMCSTCGLVVINALEVLCPIVWQSDTRSNKGAQASCTWLGRRAGP
ncbi:hypothetical protein COCVIDRAFT_86974, partial [Bipolaris victoriae FI3]